MQGSLTPGRALEKEGLTGTNTRGTGLGLGGHASQWPCPAWPPLIGVCVCPPLVSLAS